MEKLWILFSLFVNCNLGNGGYVNVALNKPANQSSRYSRDSLGPGGAVDGVVTTKWPNVIHTKGMKPNAWWQVDLKTVIRDGLVKIYFRTDFIKRRHGVCLYTSTTQISSRPSQDQLCHNVTGRADGTDIPDLVSVKCPGRWRYLMVHTLKNNDRKGPILDFGEVKVLVCDSGFYGPNCSLSCTDRHCVDSAASCPAQNGACTCQPGWKETDCTEGCPNGTYGSYCKRRCGQCYGPCNASNGNCPQGCQPKYKGTKCDIRVSKLSTLSEVTPLSIIGAAVGLLVVIVVIVIGFIVCKRNNNGQSRHANQTRKKDTKNDEPCFQLDPEVVNKISGEEDTQPVNIYSNSSQVQIVREITLGNLESHVTKVLQTEIGFQNDFDQLPSDFLASYDDSTRQENSGKNRFQGYYPYDHNRVRLSIIPGVHGSDYINASVMHVNNIKCRVRQIIDMKVLKPLLSTKYKSY